MIVRLRFNVWRAHGYRCRRCWMVKDPRRNQWKPFHVYQIEWFATYVAVNLAPGEKTRW